MNSHVASSPDLGRRWNIGRLSLATLAIAVAVIPVWVHLGYATVRWENQAWAWLLLDLTLALAPLAPLALWRPLSQRHSSRADSIAVAVVSASIVASLLSFGLAIVWL